VRCDEPPGDSCGRLLDLRAPWGRAVVRRAHVAVPAGEARAIPLQLTPRAVRTLQRHRRLRVEALLDIGLAYTGRRIVLH
jgi:hypothetical protein